MLFAIRVSQYVLATSTSKYLLSRQFRGRAMVECEYRLLKRVVPGPQSLANRKVYFNYQVFWWKLLDILHNQSTWFYACRIAVRRLNTRDCLQKRKKQQHITTLSVANTGMPFLLLVWLAILPHMISNHVIANTGSGVPVNTYTARLKVLSN